ncbi:50S ribosomal protein L18 [candidate division KSB1 bacterium]
MKDKFKEKTRKRAKHKMRVRKKISGTPERPRLSVKRSLYHVYAQLIDDINGVTLASASSLLKEIKHKKEKGKLWKSVEVGKLLAKNALSKNINEVVFDKSNYKYHGRIKALADGAREGGLKF